ncbi:MAG: hypothetical protein MI802_01710, partial [Desulfobacterales bacterium]|nr:hypothetical protein [Desulfobacterales bacterium]
NATKAKEFLIFAGFCFLGSISSRAFINRLSDKFLKDTERNIRETHQLKSKTTNIEDVLENVLTDKYEGSPDLDEEIISSLKQEEVKVLKALPNKEFKFRSFDKIVESLAEDKIYTTQIQRTLDNLDSKGFVTKFDKENGEFWAITPIGTKTILSIDNNVE